MYSINELRSWVEKAITTMSLKDKPEELYAPVSYMMSIGGKRVRPVLSLLSYNLFSDRVDDKILLPAVGLEIFHGFTLVHDDIMDNAAIRRNRDTIHKKWNNNIAILSGDVMCILAYQYLCEAAPEQLGDILKIFGRTAAQVCEGQQFDMNYEQLPMIVEADYLQMIELKTAVLIAAAAQIGAVAGGASTIEANKMYTFGHHLGMAFQIQDDLLDTYGDTKTFGKAVGSDIVTNKKTYLLVTALRCADKQTRTELELWLNNKGNTPAEKIEGVRAIYDKLQVREKAEKAINKYFDQASAILESIAVNPERKQEITCFAQQLINRKL